MIIPKIIVPTYYTTNTNNTIIQSRIVCECEYYCSLLLLMEDSFFTIDYFLLDHVCTFNFKCFTWISKIIKFYVIIIVIIFCK